MNVNQALSFQLLFVDFIDIDSVSNQQQESSLLSDSDPGQPSLPIPGLG